MKILWRRIDVPDGVRDLAEEELRRTLGPVALIGGLAAFVASGGQYLLGEAGVFRPWALIGHAALVGVALRWIRRPPRRTHAAALGVAFYFATILGTFILDTGDSSWVVHLGVVSVAAFYLLIDPRHQLAAQLGIFGWFAVGALALPRGIEVAQDAAFGAVALCAGLSLHVGRRGVLRQLQETRSALRLESEERQRAQEQALAAQKVESLAVMAGGMAHDFNNLMVGIVGGADLALESPDDPERVRSALETIRRSSSTAQELCQKMLDYAGGRPVARVSVDLNEVVREGIARATERIRPDVVVHTELAPELPKLAGDPGQLRQAVANLVANGAEAMAAHGGALRVATLLGDDERGGWLTVRVEDAGPGIPSEIRSRIFDPFFTTKFAGRGMGLATVAAAARAHGGDVAFETSDRGSGFELHLPAALDAPREAPRRPSFNFDWRGSGSVLLVDDQQVVLRTGRRMLESLGFVVRATTSGAEAVAALGASPDGFRAALVDATMPGLSGAETIHQLRLISPSLPILLSSGYSSAPERGRFPIPDDVDFLPKPYGRVELATALRGLLDAERIG